MTSPATPNAIGSFVSGNRAFDEKGAEERNDHDLGNREADHEEEELEIAAVPECRRGFGRRFLYCARRETREGKEADRPDEGGNPGDPEERQAPRRKQGEV